MERVFSLERFREKTWLVGSVGVLMGMVIYFGNVLFPLWLLSERVLSFIVLSVLIKLPGPSVFCGMVGYLHCLVLILAVLGLVGSWRLLLSFLRLPWVPMWMQAPALRGTLPLVKIGVVLADAPDVWSDGSLVVHEVSGVGVAGCGVYARASGAAWFGRKWGHLDLLPPLPDGAGEACRLYCSVPGPLQSVQRAELWGVLVALQGCLRLHVGVDNLNIVNHLAGLISGRRAGRLFPLVTDGDLLLLAQQMVRWRESRSVAVTKVKGHADEGMVAQGRVREVDRIGNKEADATADLGRKRVHHAISDARRVVNRACTRWYPVVCDLHRFFIAIARAALNED